MLLKYKLNLTEQLLLAYSIKKQAKNIQLISQHNQPLNMKSEINQKTMTSFGMCEKIQILHFSLTKLNNNGETRQYTY